MILGRLTRLSSFFLILSLRFGCLIIGYIEITGNSLAVYKASSLEDDWEDVIIYILGAGFLALLNVSLVWGIHTERKAAILPWLIVKFVAYITVTIFYGMKVYETIELIPLIEQKYLQRFIIGFCCVIVGLLLLAWYTFFCVYSYYKTGIKTPEIQEEKIEDSKHEKKEGKKVEPKEKGKPKNKKEKQKDGKKKNE